MILSDVSFFCKVRRSYNVVFLSLALGFSGCSNRTLPPAPASAPPTKTFASVAEYQRPVWSPDGTELYFSGGAPKNYRIFRVPANGGPVTEAIPQRHCWYAAIHGGTKRLAYSALGKSGWAIWVANQDGSLAKKITDGGMHVFPSWSPDGSQIAYWSRNDRTIYLVSSNGGRSRKVADGGSGPVWSPDGHQIAFVQVNRFFDAQVVLLNPTNGAQTILQSTIVTNQPINLTDYSRLHIDWSPNGREIVYPRLRNGRVQLAIIDVTKDQIVRELPIEGIATSPTWSKGGKQIAYVFENSSQPAAIRVISADGTNEKEIVRPETFVGAQFVEYNNKEAIPVPSYLYRPKASSDGLRPAIVWLHGGGISGATLESFDPGIQYFVANGFIVLAPNYRVSRGFDPRLAKPSSTQDVADDIKAAVDYLKGLKEVDTKRIGVFGASFGGFSVLAAVTHHPETFAAAVELCGPCDLSELYKQSAEFKAALSGIFGGSPEEQPDRYRIESPVSSIDKLRAPLLFIHGTSDQTISYHQSELLAQALRKSGKDFQFLTFPGVDHGFFHEAWENAMQQSMAFFLEHLKLRAATQ